MGVDLTRKAPCARDVWQSATISLVLDTSNLCETVFLLTLCRYFIERITLNVRE